MKYSVFLNYKRVFVDSKRSKEALRFGNLIYFFYINTLLDDNMFSVTINFQLIENWLWMVL